MYALLLHQRQPELRTHVGALGLLSFPRGTYCYVGSARAGLRARLVRHMRRSGKALHWHVDYLRRHTALAGLVCWPDAAGECRLAGVLPGLGGRAVPRFGCTDCSCASHLYRFENAPLRDLADLELNGVRALVLP